jgi:hypothetical protein
MTFTRAEIIEAAAKAYKERRLAIQNDTTIDPRRYSAPCIIGAALPPGTIDKARDHRPIRQITDLGLSDEDLHWLGVLQHSHDTLSEEVVTQMLGIPNEHTFRV